MRERFCDPSKEVLTILSENSTNDGEKITSTTCDDILPGDKFLFARTSTLVWKWIYSLGTNRNVKFTARVHTQTNIVATNQKYQKCICSKNKWLSLLSIWWTLNIMMKRLDWIELFAHKYTLQYFTKLIIRLSNSNIEPNKQTSTSTSWPFIAFKALCWCSQFLILFLQ